MNTTRRHGPMRVVRAVATAVAVAVSAGCAGSDRAATGTAPSPTTGVPATLHPSPDAALHEARLSSTAAFSAVPWADELKAEQDRLDVPADVESPYGRWSIPDFRGTWTNVTAGERQSYVPECSCRRRVVWLLGGSGAFGLGQRDDHTIASEIARAAERDGMMVEVRNLGVPKNLFLADEGAVMDAHLALDPTPPDVVVFYDGFNDSLFGYMYAASHDGSLLDPADRGGPWVNEYVNTDPPPDITDAQVPEVARHTADLYLAARSDIDRRAASAGISTQYFFQADALSSPLQSSGFRRALEEGGSDTTTSHLPDVLQETLLALQPGVRDARTPIGQFDQAVFGIPSFMNETGAAAVAAVMWPAIAEQLRAASGSAGP